MRSGRIDTLLNTFEYFVHHEDVLRAQATWQPRATPADDQRVLSRAFDAAHRCSFGVHRSLSFLMSRLRSHPGREPTAGRFGSRTAAELVLYLHGRMSVARVELDGARHRGRLPAASAGRLTDGLASATEQGNRPLTVRASRRPR